MTDREKDRTVEVPTVRLGDGRYFISDLDCDLRPEVRAFVARFPDYWSRHETLDGWASPQGEAPEGAFYTRRQP